ncbi:cysteine protease ATG4, partial [Akkermansia sp. BIOML-A40]
LTMPKTEILKVLNLIDRQSRYDFEYIVCELKNNKCAERYIEKCTRKGIRQYILIPIYFYLLNLFSLPNYQSLMKDYCRNSFKRLYEKEYKLAVYLVGLRLGFDSINEIYYQKLEKDMESHQQSLF